MKVSCFIIAVTYAASVRGASAQDTNGANSSGILRGISTGFRLFNDHGCRTSRGGKGSQASGDFDLIYDVSRQACKRNCLKKGQKCFGYEYSSRKCEVWKVPIEESKLKYVRGTKCYIKTGNNTPKPTPYPTETPTYDPTYDPHYFDLNQDMGCRTSRGGQGSEASGEFDIMRDVSRQTCKRKCLNKGEQCFGYEYWPGTKWCEVWKVPIKKSKLEYVRGGECYIKMGSVTPHPTESPTYYPAIYRPGVGSPFDFNQGMACRKSDGSKGSKKNGDFNLNWGVTREKCEMECLNLGHLCYGYEYGSRGRCEVWKVHIDRIKLEHVNGYDCYIVPTTEPLTEEPTTFFPSISPTTPPPSCPPNPDVPCVLPKNPCTRIELIKCCRQRPINGINPNRYCRQLGCALDMCM